MKKLLYNANQIVTFTGNSAIKGESMNMPTIIKNGCVLIDGDKIQAVFTKDEINEYPTENVPRIDCMGKTITAGYVDSHTHFVFGGYREQEFIDRLSGATYMEIMNKGGGIINTVNATRQSSQKQLIRSGLKALEQYLSFGVTTIEGKSGYGLDIETELKQIDTMRQLEQLQPIQIARTYMGAHATPPEFRTTDEYVEYMIDTVLPIIKERTDVQFVDCFCEKNVFSVDQCIRLLLKAKQLGLDIKMHAEEIECLGGSGIASRMGATSVEHLLHIDDKNIVELSHGNTIAVLLPCTAFSLREQYAPARDLIDNGVAVALGTDFNPGSCYSNSIPLLIALATLQTNMTVAETLCALTINGACAIKRGDIIGTIEKGKQADLLIHDMPSIDFLAYNFCINHVQTVIIKGQIVHHAN
ncbi:MAG: imidazolonepropionase [Clostridia bacterium]|nr:imidazolonepropionase [Clostridia bacterium]